MPEAKIIKTNKSKVNFLKTIKKLSEAFCSTSRMQSIPWQVGRSKEFLEIIPWGGHTSPGLVVRQIQARAGAIFFSLKIHPKP